MTDLLLRIDGKFTASIPLLIKSGLMKCVLASVLRRSLRTSLNNLYCAVSKMMAVTLYLADWLQRLQSKAFIYQILSKFSVLRLILLSLDVPETSSDYLYVLDFIFSNRTFKNRLQYVFTT